MKGSSRRVVTLSDSIGIIDMDATLHPFSLKRFELVRLWAFQVVL